jgi:hypothetical protein
MVWHLSNPGFVARIDEESLSKKGGARKAVKGTVSIKCGKYCE